MIGTLTDFGKAPYQFQDNNSDSYFVTLNTPKGEKTIWSVGLESALAQSGLGINDYVSVKHTGKEDVEVPVTVFKDGEEVIRTVTKYRSSFSITKAKKFTPKTRRNTHTKTKTLPAQTRPVPQNRDLNAAIQSLKFVCIGFGLGGVLLGCVALLF